MSTSNIKPFPNKHGHLKLVTPITGSGALFDSKEETMTNYTYTTEETLESFRDAYPKLNI